MHNEISWGWDPNPNTEFIMFHIHLRDNNLKVILYILDNFMHETKF